MGARVVFLALEGELDLVIFLVALALGLGLGDLADGDLALVAGFMADLELEGLLVTLGLGGIIFILPPKTIYFFSKKSVWVAVARSGGI